MRGEFGGIDPIKEEHRDARGVRLIEVVWQDMRYAVGHLRRAPALAVTVVLSLGASIGANAAIFSVVDAVLLRPLPYSSTRVDIGPSQDTAAVMEVNLPLTSYSSTAHARKFHNRLLDELRAVPGFLAAGAHLLPGGSRDGPSQPWCWQAWCSNWRPWRACGG